jgi:phage terminase large subunit-like protein
MPPQPLNGDEPKTPRRRRRRREKYFFDRDAADRVCAFFESCLTHTKGEWAGKPFRLSRWQEKHTREIFGWKRESDGLRRYREAYIEIPRKNGKSTWAAGLANYLVSMDDEPGAHVFTLANSKEQAKIVFEECRQMARSSPLLSQLVTVHREAIVVPATVSSLRPLSSESDTKDGLNPHAIVCDELHELTDRDLFEKITTAMAARRQPLTIWLTTAGYDVESICYEMHEHALELLAGRRINDSFYPVVYAAGEDDDYTSPATWKKANPALAEGTIRDTYYREQVEKVERQPAMLPAFLRYHLNIWTQSVDQAIPNRVWARGKGKITPEELAGKACFGGLDLSTTTDFTSLCLWFWDGPEKKAAKVIWRHWLPEATAGKYRARVDKIPIDLWVEQGWVTLIPGETIDYDFVEAEIKRLGSQYDIREIGIDPHNATQFRISLEGAGFTVVEMRQAMLSMSPPTKELDRLLRAGAVKHGDNPVAKWMTANVVYKPDSNENIKPVKSKAANRIDGFIAEVIAAARAMASEGPSVYETQGLDLL